MTSGVGSSSILRMNSQQTTNKSTTTGSSCGIGTTTTDSTSKAQNKNNNTTRKKPLPLKQRTSSIDQRRDYSAQTWISVLGLVKLREYVITVDHFPIWRRHLAWAVANGKDLRDYMTSRYAASMVFMSLLLSTELSVLFNSAGVTTIVRQSLRQQAHHTVAFWAGITIIISAILTLLSLISTFTAWTMVSAISDVNAHCILRSSIGQYVAELPGRFIVGSIYSFLVWFCLFVFLLLPAGFYSYLLVTIVICLFVHTITAFSAFGRVIMHTGAMGSTRIFDKGYEASLQPHSLHSNLLTKAKANLGNKTSIIRQYQINNQQPIGRMYSEDEMSAHVSIRSSASNDIMTNEAAATRSYDLPRERSESLVKFVDGYVTSDERFFPDKQYDIDIIQRESVGTPAVAKTNIRPLRPPRSYSDSLHEDVTPLIKNQSTKVVDRWIGGASSIDKHNDNKQRFNKADTMLTKDKHGHTRRISFDNPYLLFEDPTPFVPSIPHEQKDDIEISTHPLLASSLKPATATFVASTKTANEATFSPEYENDDSINVNADQLQYDMSSDDEALFNNDYGSIEGNNDGDSNRRLIFPPSTDTFNQSQNETKSTIYVINQHPLITSSKNRENDDNSDNNSRSFASEQSRLIDTNKLERGDYSSV